MPDRRLHDRELDDAMRRGLGDAIRQAPLTVAWLPRADEHELACTLGLVELDATHIEARIGELRRRGGNIKVGRWHVWRVVREMARLGVTNSPDGRIAAYVHLARGTG